MYITLPKKISVDIDNVPNDFEQKVQEAFAEYTKGTRPEFMFEDKLCFIDVIAKKLHHADATEKVNGRIVEVFSYELEMEGSYTDEEDFLTREFMEECYELGQEDQRLYSREYSKREKHANEKIMRIICRAIKAVMDYEWGNDGV